MDDPIARPPPIFYHVRVGSGTKVHRMAKGSSATFCGQWTGRSAIWRVNEPVTCERCGTTPWEGEEIIPLPPRPRWLDNPLFTAHER